MGAEGGHRGSVEVALDAIDDLPTTSSQVARLLAARRLVVDVATELAAAGAGPARTRDLDGAARILLERVLQERCR